MRFRLIEQRTKRNEGQGDKNSVGLYIPYLDTKRIWTIGYGTTYLYGVPVKENTRPITEQEAISIMRSDLFESLKIAEYLFDNLTKMTHARAEVLVDMAYNMGFNRLSGFTKLIAAVHAGEWGRAAYEIGDSKYARVDVPERAAVNERAMLKGRWE